MKQVIKGFVAAGIASFAMIFAVFYFGWVIPGRKGTIGFIIFLIVFSYIAAILSSRREKAQRAKMRKVVWNA